MSKMKQVGYFVVGPDRESLIQRLTETLTNVRITVSKENGADLIYKPK